MHGLGLIETWLKDGYISPFAGDIASALGLWHQRALKPLAARIVDRRLSSVSEHCMPYAQSSPFYHLSTYPERHSHEKSRQALPRVCMGGVWGAGLA